MPRGRALKQLLLGMLASIAAACSAPDKGPVLSGIDLSIPDNTSALRSGDLRISPLDVLDIKVFGAKDLDGAYQVDPAGEIKMPLVGVVSAKGYTIFELAGILEGKLGETFLQDPQVSVRISEIYGQQFTVEGSIRSPGVYPVRGPMTLLQAVAVSGGPSEGADTGRVVIFRTIEGQRKAAAFDLRKIRNGSSEDPAVYGNDIIVIDGSDAKTGYDELLRSLPLVGLFMAIL